MIIFTLKIQQVESLNKPYNASNPVVVSIHSSSDKPTPDESNYAGAFHEIIKYSLHNLMASQVASEAIEGEDSEGLKAQLDAMLKRHGVTGFKISEK